MKFQIEIDTDETTLNQGDIESIIGMALTQADIEVDDKPVKLYYTPTAEKTKKKIAFNS